MLPVSSNNKRKRKRKVKEKNSGPQLNKAVIIEKAVEIIDEKGLESFSMRSLAKSLDVYPTAIYWYIPNRNALIGEVINFVLDDLIPDNHGLSWQEVIEGIFVNYRARIFKHPNIAPLIGVQLVSNASVNFDMIELIMKTLREAGFKDSDLPRAYNAVIAGMVGFTTQEFALIPSDEQEVWASEMRRTIESIDGEKYPITTALMPDLINQSFILRWENGISNPLDSGFNFFCKALILGLESILNHQE